ncbi:MAG: type III-A CRISPR-associated protein Csm2 [Lachnospiraceae bacterium]|nr:type III-A CRISPR-associated protein Csm2 [Lachnospiraceae bacterium]
MIGHIDKIGESRENALLFCRYMESLIAYHKFYGGRDR